MVCPEGIEPPTHSLEGCCSIQLSYGQNRCKKGPKRGLFDDVVGAIGFEPTTSWSQTRRSTRLSYTPTVDVQKSGERPTCQCLPSAETKIGRGPVVFLVPSGAMGDPDFTRRIVNNLFLPRPPIALLVVFLFTLHGYHFSRK